MRLSRAVPSTGPVGSGPLPCATIERGRRRDRRFRSGVVATASPVAFAGTPRTIKLQNPSKLIKSVRCGVGVPGWAPCAPRTLMSPDSSPSSVACGMTCACASVASRCARSRHTAAHATLLNSTVSLSRPLARSLARSHISPFDVVRRDLCVREMFHSNRSVKPPSRADVHAPDGVSQHPMRASIRVVGGRVAAPHFVAQVAVADEGGHAADGGAPRAARGLLLAEVGLEDARLLVE